MDVAVEEVLGDAVDVVEPDEEAEQADAGHLGKDDVHQGMNLVLWNIPSHQLDDCPVEVGVVDLAGVPVQRLCRVQLQKQFVELTQLLTGEKPTKNS